MPQKIHRLNGFDYTHERLNFNGTWVFNWRFKPVDMSEWCPFSLPLGKTKKTDMESFLRSKEDATHHYQAWLKDACNVEEAERRLSDAKKKVERISSPDWGGRGNNPNKDSRITRQARSELDSAERNLVRAQELREKLSKP